MLENDFRSHEDDSVRIIKSFLCEEYDKRKRLRLLTILYAALTVLTLALTLWAASGNVPMGLFLFVILLAPITLAYHFIKAKIKLDKTAVRRDNNVAVRDGRVYWEYRGIEFSEDIEKMSGLIRNSDETSASVSDTRGYKFDYYEMLRTSGMIKFDSKK